MNIFEKIVSRQMSATIIWESDTHLAFLDINPIQPGHTLVIPKKQVNYIFDMNDKDYIDLMLASKQVATLLKEKYKCKRVCVLIEGYDVPHVHVKLIPTNSANDLQNN
jgi:histidine triad (HIT) family protein